MIRESQNWTSSELIYLFADGEADDVQKSLLFTALANDAGLQAEFSDVLRINAALKDSGLEENPPKHVTAALFQKAGFGVAAETTSIAVAGGLWLMPHLRSLVVPLVSAFVGGVLALLFAPEILQHSGRDNRAAVAEHASTTYGMPHPNALPHGKDLPESRSAATTTPIEAAGRTIASRNTLKSITKEGKKKGLQDASTLQNAEQPVENTENPETIHSDTRSLSGEPEMREIGLSFERHVAVESLQTSDELHEFASATVRSLSATQPTPVRIRDPRFALQARGLADIEMFPNRSLNVGKPTAFENIAIAGFYRISESHAIGIEAGREYHPLYVPTGSRDLVGINDYRDPSIDITINGTGPTIENFTGSSTGAGGNLRNSNLGEAVPVPLTSDTTKATSSGYRLVPRTSWFGLAYQFRAAPIDRLGLIRPYVQTMVGGTQFGPIGKGTLGLSWTPDSRVSFNLGIEGTAVLYRNSGDWYSSRKLGLAYSAQVNF